MNTWATISEPNSKNAPPSQKKEETDQDKT